MMQNIKNGILKMEMPLMTRKELLEVGKIVADRWYEKNVPIIQARQNISRQKKRLTRRQAKVSQENIL